MAQPGVIKSTIAKKVESTLNTSERKARAKAEAAKAVRDVEVYKLKLKQKRLEDRLKN